MDVVVHDGVHGGQRMVVVMDYHVVMDAHVVVMDHSVVGHWHMVVVMHLSVQLNRRVVQVVVVVDCTVDRVIFAIAIGSITGERNNNHVCWFDFQRNLQVKEMFNHEEGIIDPHSTRESVSVLSCPLCSSLPGDSSH